LLWPISNIFNFNPMKLSKKTVSSPFIFLILAVLFSGDLLAQSNCASDSDVVKYKGKVDAGEDVQSCALCQALAVYICRSYEITDPSAYDAVAQRANITKTSLQELGGFCCPDLLSKPLGSRPTGSVSGTSSNEYNTQNNIFSSGPNVYLETQEQRDQYNALAPVVEGVVGILGAFASDREERRQREAQEAANRRAAEAEKKRIAERERQRREQIRKENEARSSFLASLTDQNIPVQIEGNNTEVFCFFVNKESNSAISFSLFSLYANDYNKIPYKVDVVKAYQQQSGKTNFYLYGTFNSIEAAKSKIKTLTQNANNSYIEIYQDVIFKMAQEFSQNNPAQQTPKFDAWGNQISPKTQPAANNTTSNPATPKYDAWGNLIKSTPPKSNESFQPVEAKPGPPNGRSDQNSKIEYDIWGNPIKKDN